MDISMRTYESQTGYVRRTTDKRCFKAKTIYLGINDKAENYEDVSKAVYDKFIKAEEEKVKALMAKH